MDCIFCKIASGAIPAKIVHEDDQLIAFHDLQPQAPTHILVIPKRHFSTLNELTDDDAALVGQLVIAARAIARDAGFADDGFRVVMNCNEQGGQSVYHIHLHLLAGRQMHWPPG